MTTKVRKQPKTEKTAEQAVADALRSVAAKLIKALDKKYINRTSIDGDTLYETLHLVADELDPGR